MTYQRRGQVSGNQSINSSNRDLSEGITRSCKRDLLEVQSLFKSRGRTHGGVVDHEGVNVVVV